MYSDPSGNQYVDYRDKEPNGIAIGAGAGGGLLLGLIDLIKDGGEAAFCFFSVPLRSTLKSKMPQEKSSVNTFRAVQRTSFTQVGNAYGCCVTLL